MLRKTNFENVPMKPQRVYQCLNRAFDDKDTCYVTTIGLSQIAAAQFLHVYKPRHWINCGQAGPLGWTIPAALGVRVADPTRRIIALSGDYDFQFMIEELAVGAQFKLPYIHIVVNNAYLGLIRQSQRGFDMDYCVQLSFDNVNAPRRERLRRRPRRGGRRAGLQGHPRHAAGGDRPRDRAGREVDGRAQGARRRRDHAGARDQHRDGHRDRQVVEFEELAGNIADAPTAIAALLD
jgi:tartronate-semialdehyde synthase